MGEDILVVMLSFPWLGRVCTRPVLKGDLCQLHCDQEQFAEPVSQPGVWVWVGMFMCVGVLCVGAWLWVVGVGAWLWVFLCVCEHIVLVCVGVYVGGMTV